MVGDAVDELRAEPAGETPLEVFHVEPVLVHADGDERRLEASECLDRAQVRGGFDDDQVAGVEEDFAISSSASTAPARDQQLVVCRAAPCSVSSRPASASQQPGEPARRGD